MKEQVIQKINQIGKVSSIFALIAKIIVGIGIVCTIIGAVVCFTIPKGLINITTEGVMSVEMDLASIGVTATEEERAAMTAALQEELMSDEEELSDVTVSTDENTVQFTGKTESLSFTIRDGAWAVVVATIVLVLTFVTLCFVSALCKAFRDCQSPFEENVIKKMQNLAIALLPWCMISYVGDSVFESIVNKKISIQLGVDLGVALVVLVVWVLVYIFKYGAVLQQESDETL